MNSTGRPESTRLVVGRRFPQRDPMVVAVEHDQLVRLGPVPVETDRQA